MIPKYIENALRRRTKAAVSFGENDSILSRYIERHPELLETIDSEDYFGGVESIINPYDSEIRVRTAIENFLKEKQREKIYGLEKENGFQK